MTSPLFRNALATLIFISCSVSAAQVQAPERSSHPAQPVGPLVLTVDPAKSVVHWTVDSSLHTVHGTFHVKRGTLSVNPATGKASGEIVVDATSGESGSDARDRRMHHEIIESDRYSEIIFRPDQVSGTILRAGISDLKLHGTFTLHGADHDFTASAHAQLDAQSWKCSAEFPIPYIEWKLKNPSNFLLKVKPVVEVHADLVGSLRP